MKKLYFSIFLSLLSGLSAYAQPISSAGGTNGSHIWFVNGMTATHSDANVAQAAHDMASADDTIYIEQHGTSYGDLVITKPLVIIGSGYFLEDNDTTQHIKDASTLDAVTFNAGSEGTQIMGFEITGQVTVNVDSITIKRNLIQNADAIENIRIMGDRKRVYIFQNYIYNGYNPNVSGGASVSSTDYSTIYMDGYTQMVYIENNIIHKENAFSFGNGTDFYPAIRMIDNNSNAFVRNNIIWGDLYLRNTIFENNIFMRGFIFENYSLGHCYNNIDGVNLIGNNGTTKKDNQYLAWSDMDTDLFNSIGFNSGGSEYGLQWLVDTAFWLEPGCIAEGAGLNGEDCGVFDGNMPYQISGMPYIPSIFEFDAPVMINGPTMEIRVKAITHH